MQSIFVTSYKLKISISVLQIYKLYPVDNFHPHWVCFYASYRLLLTFNFIPIFILMKEVANLSHCVFSFQNQILLNAVSPLRETCKHFVCFCVCFVAFEN